MDLFTDTVAASANTFGADAARSPTSADTGEFVNIEYLRPLAAPLDYLDTVTATQNIGQ